MQPIDGSVELVTAQEENLDGGTGKHARINFDIPKNIFVPPTQNVVRILCMYVHVLRKFSRMCEQKYPLPHVVSLYL